MSIVVVSMSKFSFGRKNSLPTINKGAYSDYVNAVCFPCYNSSFPLGNGKKKAHIDGSFVQTPINRFRANKLLKDPLLEGMLLQPKLTLFKQISVEFVKN